MAGDILTQLTLRLPQLLISKIEVIGEHIKVAKPKPFYFRNSDIVFVVEALAAVFVGS